MSSFHFALGDTDKTVTDQILEELYVQANQFALVCEDFMWLHVIEWVYHAFLSFGPLTFGCKGFYKINQVVG